jgi:hypothetical protein
VYFVSVYENRRIKPVEIVLRRGERRRSTEGVNQTKIYCKHICKITMSPPYSYYTLIKFLKKHRLTNVPLYQYSETPKFYAIKQRK